MCTYYIILYSECVLMNVFMLQVQVHIYTISAIYCKLMIGHKMHYGGCTSSKSWLFVILTTSSFS